LLELNLVLCNRFAYSVENNEPRTRGSLIDGANEELLEFLLIELRSLVPIGDRLLGHWLRVRILRGSSFDCHSLVVFSQHSMRRRIYAALARDKFLCGFWACAFRYGKVRGRDSVIFVPKLVPTVCARNVMHCGQYLDSCEALKGVKVRVREIQNTMTRRDGEVRGRLGTRQGQRVRLCSMTSREGWCLL
jgi:hypothetical protein